MQIAQALILSITQGVTELLPISSSGHLLIFSQLMNIEPSLIFLTFLHFSTGLAILFGYRSKIVEIIKSSKRIDYFIKILIAAIPGALAGVLFDKAIERYLYKSSIIAIDFIFWGIVMIATELYFAKRFTVKKKSINEITKKDSLIIGLSQIIALVPGTSRSGITTMTGMYLGIEKGNSLDFSFLIGLPIIFGSFFYEFLKNFKSAEQIINSNYLIALIATTIIGYLAVIFLQRIKQRNFLTLFGIYRIIAGLLVLIFLR